MATDPWSLINGCISVVTCIYDTIRTDQDNSQLIGSLGSEALRVKAFLERLMGRELQLHAHAACEQLEILHGALKDLKLEVDKFVMSGARPNWKRVYRFVNARGTQEKLQGLQSRMYAAISRLMDMANLEVGFQQLDLTVGVIDQLAAQSYHMWKVGEVALQMQRQQGLDAENKEQVVAGLAVIGTKLDEILHRASPGLLARISTSGAAHSGGADSRETEAMERKHLQQITCLLAETAEKTAQTSARPSQHASAAAQASAQAELQQQCPPCPFCLEIPTDPVLIPHQGFCSMTYCFDCLTKWLKESSRDFSRAPLINGVPLPGTSVQLLTVHSHGVRREGYMARVQGYKAEWVVEAPADQQYQFTSLERCEHLMVEGDNFVEAGNVSSAAGKYTAALQLLEAGDMEENLRWWDLLLPCRLRLARCRLGQQRHEDCIGLCTAVLSILDRQYVDPRFLRSAYLLRAKVHLDRGDADAARADLDSARVNGASEQDVQAGMEHAHALRQSSSCDRGYPAEYTPSYGGRQAAEDGKTTCTCLPCVALCRKAVGCCSGGTKNVVLV